MDRITFEATIGGNSVTLAVTKPSKRAQNQSNVVYRQAMVSALDNGAIFEEKLTEHMKKQDLWSDAQEIRKQEIFEEINASILKIEKGGIKLSEAKNIALNIKKLRKELSDLTMVYFSLRQTLCAEAIAQNEQFDYLVYATLVYNDTNEPVFKSFDDYLKSPNEPYIATAAQNLSKLVYGIDEDFDKTLPENKFLMKRGFVDDKLRLINKDGHLVDENGRLVDENGRFVNEQGEFVDKYGNRVDFDGNYLVESQPFLDDDGNQIE